MNINKLKGYFKEKDLTYMDVAQKSGLSYNTVAKVVKTVKCNIETAKSIIVATEMPPQMALDIFFENSVSK